MSTDLGRLTVGSAHQHLPEPPAVYERTYIEDQTVHDPTLVRVFKRLEIILLTVHLQVQRDSTRETVRISHAPVMQDSRKYDNPLRLVSSITLTLEPCQLIALSS